jgi:hypothetical protein
MPQLQIDGIFALGFGIVVGTGSAKLGYCQIHHRARLLRSTMCMLATIYNTMLTTQHQLPLLGVAGTISRQPDMHLL